VKCFVLAALCAAAALPAAASTMTGESKVCPVCLADIFHNAQMSASVFDTGLDFRPLGAVVTPSPLPVCSECGFVVHGSSAGPRALAAMREITASPRYKALSARSSYYRLAFLYKKTGAHDQADIGQAYLKASWQEENDPVKLKEDLGLAFFHLNTYMAGIAKGSPEWPVGQYLLAELLRRLSNFSEAKKILRGLSGKQLPGALNEFVNFQLTLCARKDPAPRSAGEMRK